MLSLQKKVTSIFIVKIPGLKLLLLVKQQMFEEVTVTLQQQFKNTDVQK